MARCSDLYSVAIGQESTVLLVQLLQTCLEYMELLEPTCLYQNAALYSLTSGHRAVAIAIRVDEMMDVNEARV